MATYQLISSVTVGSGGASSIDFTSIPATYTDLVLKLSVRNSRNDGQTFDQLLLTFNNDTGANYSSRLVYGYNGSAGSNSQTGGNAIVFAGYTNTAADTANTFANVEFYVPNYLVSQYKSVSGDSVNENNATNGGLQSLGAGLWNSNSAINRTTIAPASGTFVQYSTAYLYGIKNS